MNVVKSTLSSSFIAAAAVLASLPAQAAPACGSVTSIERRIVEHADGDVGVLRAFVDRISIIYGLNMIDVRDNLDQWRATLVCRQQLAAQGAARTVAARPAGAVGDDLVSRR